MSYLPNPFVIPVGLLIGILVSAPVGPVNVLCIRRALQSGPAGGIAAGVGATLADGLIAMTAGLGIGAIATTVRANEASIQLIGSAILVAFGLVLFQKRAAIEADLRQNGPAQVVDYIWDVPKAFLLTVTNPGAVLGLFAIFGWIGSYVSVRGPGDAMLLAAAIMAGSMSWWLLLSMTVASMRDHFESINLQRINRLAGMALIGFGLLLIGELVWDYWVVA